MQPHSNTGQDLVVRQGDEQETDQDGKADNLTGEHSFFSTSVILG
jgi:hypothetical protein